jgi:hypothetical protein
MICTLNGSCYTVTVTNAEVNAFARTYPCHGLDLDADYVFQFDARNGDLLEVSALRDGERLEDVTEEEDGGALSALSEDATLTGAEELGLRDVLGIRFGLDAVYAL